MDAREMSTNGRKLDAVTVSPEGKYGIICFFRPSLNGLSRDFKYDENSLT